MRHFSDTDSAELLQAIAICREASVRAITKAPIDSEVYRRASKLVDTIDDVAEALTGDREHFHAKLKPGGIMG